MEMHQVQYFLALCEEQNFTRAAKRCGVSQPSLTNAIKRLEAELGGSLFHRNRVNTRLTDLGIKLRADFEQIDRFAADIKRKETKVLSLRSMTLQPRPMEAFMRLHHVIAVVAALIIGIGAKQFLFPPKQAEANIQAMPSASMNTLQMHIDHLNKNDLPVQKMHDMSVVFSAPD